MNIETVNGTQMTLEMWMPELFPKPTVGVSAHLARISVLPEKEQALTVTDHPSLEKYLESSGKRGKKIDPNGLSMKTLRECFRQIGGVTSCQYSWKWTNWGMTQNGRFSTQKIGECRKIGSECILSDILEPKADGKYFLSAQLTEKIVFKSDKSDKSKQIEIIPKATGSIQVGGVSPTLNTMGGGGREPHIPVTVSRSGIGGGTEVSHPLMARNYKGIGNQEMTAVILKCSELTSISGEKKEQSQTQLKPDMTQGLQTLDRTVKQGVEE